MVASNSNSSSISSCIIGSSRIRPHLTVRLVLELMDVDRCASQRRNKPFPRASLLRPAPGSALTTSGGVIHEENEEALRAALLVASRQVDCCAAPDRLLAALGTTRRHDRNRSSSSNSSSSSGGGSSYDEQNIGSEGSWEEELEQWQWELKDYWYGEDRARLGASARSGDLSLDDRLWMGGSASESCESSALEEVEDCTALTGVVAAIYGYKASGGDLVFLEKAYDLARGVAASKYDLTVAFNACRVALAVGYVYTVKHVSLDSARIFALHHSLPKLALSLQPYWSRGTTELNKQANELKWQECALSLLEVGSSVSLLANERDVFCCLDADMQLGVTEAIGMYCVLNPAALSQYPDVGRTCKERYLSILGFEQRESTAGKVHYSNYVPAPAAGEQREYHEKITQEQNCFVGSE